MHKKSNYHIFTDKEKEDFKMNNNSYFDSLLLTKEKQKLAFHIAMELMTKTGLRHGEVLSLLDNAGTTSNQYTILIKINRI